MTQEKFRVSFISYDYVIVFWLEMNSKKFDLSTVFLAMQGLLLDLK